MCKCIYLTVWLCIWMRLDAFGGGGLTIDLLKYVSQMLACLDFGPAITGCLLKKEGSIRLSESIVKSSIW